jgi:hypothetical protein
MIKDRLYAEALELAAIKAAKRRALKLKLRKERAELKRR